MPYDADVIVAGAGPTKFYAATAGSVAEIDVPSGRTYLPPTCIRRS